MDKVISFDQIQGFISEIRNLRKGFVTNFFWDSKRHPYWIAKGTIHYVRGNDCYLLLQHNNDFVNLFFIASCYEVVAEVLKTLKTEKDLVIDVVCRGDGDKELLNFEEVGFTTYRHLYRMSHTGLMPSNEWKKEASVVHGNTNDVALVWQVLQRDFDPLCEQLPSLEEIEDFAERNELLVIKDEDRLCGFLIAEHLGITWYLRYWYTSPDYRNQGIGAKLLKTSLLMAGETKRQIFWVISDNDNAIKRYEHYGFKRENMNDYVLIKKI